ncbi:MAG: four helix bundle protein [Planctomycetes bacterium]|nr:four helix bundle protein [Planctomycetota bacterium]
MDNDQNHKPYDLEPRTLEFAKAVVRFCKRLSKNTINNEHISQVIRSSGSVGANYREANEALTKKDFVYRIKICRKEAKETHFWLELMLEANPDFKAEISGLMNEAIELKKIFSAIINKSV